MLYQLEQGPTEKKIISTCIRERRPLPQAIANAPELMLGLELFYMAFLDLTTERFIGMGEGPIPWSRIEQYCTAKHLSGEQRDDMHYHIRALDGVYLEHRAKSSKVESAQPVKPVRRGAKSGAAD